VVGTVLPRAPDGAGEPSGTATPDEPTPAAADLGSINDCDLLTQEEAAAAAGNPVLEAKLLGAVCSWEPEDVTVPSQLQVSIGLVPTSPSAYTAEQACETGREMLSNPEPKDGFGDRSYREYTEGTFGNSGTLLVCLPNGTVHVAAIGGRPESELWQVVTEMTATALGRL
jgi:hypothetical protein